MHKALAKCIKCTDENRQFWAVFLGIAKGVSLAELEFFCKTRKFALTGILVCCVIAKQAQTEPTNFTSLRLCLLSLARGKAPLNPYRLNF